MNRIPSDEEFARAKQLMREDFRNLDEVSRRVKQHFRKQCPIHNVYILPQRDVNFRAYVFFEKDSDIELCKKSRMTDSIQDVVYSELERAGRGRKGEVTVAFEFDSDENVTAHYEGDYYLRLH